MKYNILHVITMKQKYKSTSSYDHNFFSQYNKNNLYPGNSGINS